MIACAKINLILNVKQRRPDGYHELDTIFYPLRNVADTLSWSDNEPGNGIRISCAHPGVPLDPEKNLCGKAVTAYAKAAGLPLPDCNITLTKVIPCAGGMGGGSSDCAAVLRFLQEKYHALTDVQLAQLALTLGADVPFCVLNGTHRCGGVGEILIPLAPMPKCGLVIVKPPVSVSTPEAYKQCDTKPDSGVRYTREMVRAIERRSLPDVAAKLGNRFDDALQIPEMRAIEAALLQAGAMNAVMTGSGSAVFGIFETKAAAEAAAAALDPALGEIFTAEPVSAQEAQL